MTRRRRHQSTTRQYIRHPSGMPIECAVCGDVPPLKETLRNVSKGGLCFYAKVEFEPGYPVRMRIPVLDRDYEAEGIVIWCRGKGAGYEVGVRLANAETWFSLRMVEQICYIEEYRREVEREQGRRLNSEEAAREWVENFAGDFPSLS